LKQGDKEKKDSKFKVKHNAILIYVPACLSIGVFGGGAGGAVAPPWFGQFSIPFGQIARTRLKLPEYEIKVINNLALRLYSLL